MSTPDFTSSGLRRRRAVNRLMELLAWACAAIAVGILGIVVFSVARRGAGAFNLDLLTKTPVPFALGPVKQGLANAFVGIPIMQAWLGTVYEAEFFCLF